MIENPLQINFKVMRAPCPPRNLTCEQLTEYHQYNCILAGAHEQAEQILANARAQIEHEAEQARADLAAAQNQAELDRESYALEVKESVIKDTLEWVVQMKALDEEAGSRLSVRWRSATAQILRKLLGQKAQVEVLLEQIEAARAEKMQTGSISLLVSATDYEEVQAAFAGSSSVSVLIDDTLHDGKAILDDERVRLYFDLKAWQERIIAQFCAISPSESIHES